MDRPEAVRARGDDDHAIAHVGQQQVGQREVAEVVGAELHLEAVLGALLGHGHHARVVDEDVEVALPRIGEGAHRGEVGEVELAHLGLAVDGGGGRLALGDVADGEHDARAGAAELTSGSEADAAVGAGDDEGASIETGKILGGPFGGGGHVSQSSW